MERSPEPGTTGRRIVKGALVLGAAAVVSKLLGTLQKIPLQNMAGDNVFGIYNAVYPLYILILYLATAGFPVAVAKFVAEELAKGRRDEAGRVLRKSLILSTAVGACCFVALFLGAGRIAELIGSKQTEPAIRAVSYALLAIPALSSLRGYFQGMNDMVPTAVSQVAEQLIRVAAMLACLILFVQAGASDAVIASGATFGSVAGAVAGLAVMIGYWIAHKRVRRGGWGRMERDGPKSLDPGRGVGYRTLAAYALPICIGSAIVPILTLVDTFTIPRLLVREGWSEIGSMSQFGLYNHGLPLVQLVAMVMSSASVAIVPAISAAKAAGDTIAMRSSVEASMRFAWLIGLGASAGLAVLAVPLNVMLYEDAAGSAVVAAIGFTAVFSVIQIVTAAILQGIGAERLPAYHLLGAAAVKIGLNLLLVPVWGIFGAAIAAVAAHAAAAALNVAALSRLGVVRPSWRHYGGRPLLAAALMAAAAGGLAAAADSALAAALPGMSERWRATASALPAVAAGALVYAVLLLRTGAVMPAELRAVPKLGDKLDLLLRKWRLIPYEGGRTCPHPLPSSDSAPETKTN